MEKMICFVFSILILQLSIAAIDQKFIKKSLSSFFLSVNLWNGAVPFSPTFAAEPNSQIDQYKLYSTGQEFLVNGQFTEALEYFNKAATVTESINPDVFISRGITLEKVQVQHPLPLFSLI